MRQPVSATLFVSLLLGGIVTPCVSNELREVPCAQPAGAAFVANDDTNRELMPEPIKPISSVHTGIAPPDGRLPMDRAMSDLPSQRIAPPEHLADGAWAAFHWAAPGTCHRPLYFENPSLERHGYSLGIFQPVASAAHFVGSTAVFPYRLVAEPTCDCVYTLGHERPGTPTQLHYYRPPFSVAGGVTQAGVVTGLIFLLP